MKKTATKKPASNSKIKKIMKEYKDGTLKDASGKKVTDFKQAVAIGISEQVDKDVKKGKKKKSVKAKA